MMLNFSTLSAITGLMIFITQMTALSFGGEDINEI